MAAWIDVPVLSGILKAIYSRLFRSTKGGETTLTFSSAGDHIIKFPVTKGVSVFGILWTLGNGCYYGKFSSVFSLYVAGSGLRLHEQTSIKPVIDGFKTDNLRHYCIDDLFRRPDCFKLSCNNIS